MSDDDAVAVAVMRVADMPDPVAGSVQLKCQGCSQPVWISPATRRSVTNMVEADKIVRIECIHCLEAELK